MTATADDSLVAILLDAYAVAIPTPLELAADLQARATVLDLAETLTVLGEAVVVEHEAGIHSVASDSGAAFAAWPFGAYVGCAYLRAEDAEVDTWWERVRAVQHVSSELWT